MKRFLPKSIFGQTLLVLIVGLIISHAVASCIYTLDRQQAIRDLSVSATAQRITNLARLVRDAPHDRQKQIVTTLSDQTFCVSLSTQPMVVTAMDADQPIARKLKQLLVDQLSLGPARQPRVWAAPMHGPIMHAFSTLEDSPGNGDLLVAVPLADGQWLSVGTTLPEGGPVLSREFIVSMGLMEMIVIGMSVWVVRRVTAPLASLSAAADKLGNDLNAPPMPEAGTIETRRASRAFNSMQARLRDLIESRTRLLAAISHDLRTPLTLLRLRAENVEDLSEREKMISTITEMGSMIGATLEFARDEAAAEPRRRTDLTALLGSVVDDMADAGLPIAMEQGQPVIYNCQPAALKRALTNLLDNAIKYGKRARAALRSAPPAIEITIEDEGPGIAEDELTRVFQPFYRVEGSRSRETGGIGLGLALARSVVEAHGGKLTLINRTEGGLRALVTLPI
jgi:signal transduction histidine kinase